MTRATGNYDLRKVKGHAAQEDIDQCRSNPEDKEGNGVSDHPAGEGVKTLNGDGLTRLSRWFAERHRNYCKLIKRIHKMIITIALAEKEGRAIRERIATAIDGPNQAARSGSIKGTNMPTGTYRCYRP